MGALGSRLRLAEPSLPALTSTELFNRLQDTRALVLVVSAVPAEPSSGQESWDDTSELRFLSPALFRKGISEVISRRNARGWSVVVVGEGEEGETGAHELRRWLCRHGFCSAPNSLVSVVERLPCRVQEFYSHFPFLEPEHEHFELGRLYPSLITVVGAGTQLFLSNWGVASDPHTYNALGIKYVVNCSCELPFVDEIIGTQGLGRAPPLDPDLEGPMMQQPICAELRTKLAGRLRVPVQDGADQRICDYLPESMRFLQQAVDSQNGHVLIHCKHGQSRSATVMAAFLLHLARQMGRPKTVEEVLTELKACRPRVSPNLGFLKQLQEFASELRQEP